MTKLLVSLGLMLSLVPDRCINHYLSLDKCISFPKFRTNSACPLYDSRLGTKAVYSYGNNSKSQHYNDGNHTSCLVGDTRKQKTWYVSITNKRKGNMFERIRQQNSILSRQKCDSRRDSTYTLSVYVLCI